MCQSNTDEKNPIPKLTPLEYFLVNTVRFENIDEEELITKAKRMFEIDAEKVKKAYDSITNHQGYIVKNTGRQDQSQSDSKPFLSISSEALETIYPRPYSIPEDKSDDHHSTIRAIAQYEISRGNYCIDGSNGSENTQADLTVYRLTPKIGIRGFNTYNTMHPNFWSNKVLAVEVEDDPINAKEQIYRNYVKNTSRGMSVIFIVFNEKDMNCIIDCMVEHGVENDSYGLAIIDLETFIFPDNKIRHA